MIEKIEARIEAYINSILTKDVIDYSDYQVLSNESSRLRMIAETERLKKETEQQHERMMKMFSRI